MENAYPYAQNVRLSVAVDARECRKLIKFYKNHIKKDRYIESLLDNPDFPEFALYYGSDETTEFNVNQFGFLKHYGIFIVIRVLSLQYTSSIGRKIRMMAEEGWALAHGRVGGSVSRFLAYFCISDVTAAIAEDLPKIFLAAASCLAR